MRCPNCGEHRCNCTYDEMAQAIQIQRRKDAAERKQTGRETVVERDRRERKERTLTVSGAKR
jgi:hypothetical protein